MNQGPSSEPGPGARPRPSSLVNEGQGEIVKVPAVPVAPDPRVLEDLEREARRLATEVSFSGYFDHRQIPLAYQITTISF